MYNLNPKETVITITNFISSYIQQSGTKGAVIGLSGGIDSTVSAYLSVKALGKENVFGILIPEKELTSPEDILDATEVAHILNIDFSVVEISEIIKLFYHSIPEVDKTNRLATGNLKARIRMSILYYYANHFFIYLELFSCILYRFTFIQQSKKNIINYLVAKTQIILIGLSCPQTG